MSDKFRVRIPSLWQEPWPEYFNNFYKQCKNIAYDNGWHADTVMNYHLKPLGGRLIQTKTQGWYLRWDKEENHTFFVLKWS